MRPREVLGDLLREERERLNRIEDESAARAAAAVVPVPAGVPALEHGSAMESLMTHDPGYLTPQAEFGGRERPNFLVEELEAGQRRQLAERAAIKGQKGE